MKIIKVNCCAKCPYRGHKNTGPDCLLERRSGSDPTSIPDWCPLPGSSQQCVGENTAVFCEIDDCINQSVGECSLDMIFIEGSPECRMCASFVGRKDQEKAAHAEIDRVEAMGEKMRPAEWIVGNDTGVSSKTIWAIMMGGIPENPHPFAFDVPHDPGDFGRCYRLLKLFPEWKKRLSEVATVFPKWGPIVREWNKMTELYERDYRTGRSAKLFNLMCSLEEEGRQQCAKS